MNFSSSQDFGFGNDQIVPADGWHCAHFFYKFDRAQLMQFGNELRAQSCEDFLSVFPGNGSDAPQRLQLGLVSGHKADFSLMMMDPDPIKLQSIHHRLMSSKMGPAIVPTYSYISISEISEYVQSIDKYRERLIRSGEDPSGTALETKVAAYEQRLEKMNFQRLTPNFPDWPVSCFYPMNKWRYPGANWFSLSSSERNKLMGEHARSGIKFAGKVSQLITVGIGLDDWEWGVTLWATNPMHLKQIVYDMRFDEASAKYAEFGAFYTSYLATPEQILKSCRVM